MTEFPSALIALFAFLVIDQRRTWLEPSHAIGITTGVWGIALGRSLGTRTLALNPNGLIKRPAAELGGAAGTWMKLIPGTLDPRRHALRIPLESVTWVA
jgi:hypothetical protein